MTDLEKEMHKEYQSSPRTGRRVDHAIRAAAIVAERHIEQKLLQHGVSGKRPTPDIDKLLHDFAVECGYSDEFHLCAMSENISTEHMKQFALYYQAACASGGVDTKPAREVCIKGGERLENGECAKCNLLWGKCCAELL